MSHLRMGHSAFYFIASMTIEHIKEQVIGGKPADEEQAVFLTEYPDKESLYRAAHEITCACMGNKFDTCSIINAKSGNCSEDCKWCAQSSFYKTNVELYPLLPLEECLRHALRNDQQGIRRFALVTSGKKVTRKDLENLTRQISELRDAAAAGGESRSRLEEERASVLERAIWKA